MRAAPAASDGGVVVRLGQGAPGPQRGAVLVAGEGHVAGGGLDDQVGADQSALGPSPPKAVIDT